jgi:hypothetical protein
MKFANPTQRKEFLRCPRRYFFRYLFQPTSMAERIDHAARRDLYAVREFGGHLVHASIAAMFRSMARGNYKWDHAKEAEKCVGEMFSVAAKSIVANPGELIGGKQLAETYNGASAEDIQDQLRHWRDQIPIMLENAYRIALTLEIKEESENYEVMTETEIVFKRHGQTYHYVIDLIIRTPEQTICVDFKTHAIDNEDLNQVRNYLDCLRIEECIPVSRLTGLAVDLRREEIVHVHYDPFGVQRRTSRNSSLRDLLPSPRRGDKAGFEPAPHRDLCLRCPYSSACSASVIHSWPRAISYVVNDELQRS